MTRTRAELISQALEVLGLLPAGQTLEAEDFDLMDRRIDPALAELKSRDVFASTDPDNFDDEIFLPLVDAIAGITAGANGKDKINGLDAETFRRAAELRLRRVTRSDALDIETTADYF